MSDQISEEVIERLPDAPITVAAIDELEEHDKISLTAPVGPNSDGITEIGIKIDSSVHGLGYHPGKEQWFAVAQDDEVHQVIHTLAGWRDEAGRVTIPDEEAEDLREAATEDQSE